MSDPEAVLSVRGLTVSLRARGLWRPILHDVSFEVGKGETVAVVGESGSGKSVTALSIMRLIPPRTMRIQGQVWLERQDLLALGEDEMRRVRGNRAAMIFQEPMTSLNPVMTIGRQIAEAVVAHRETSWDEAFRQAARLLDRVRISGASTRLKDYPHQFSGGMRQRVMIAMALACSPTLLIADEPTTALDVTVQAEILNLIRELQREQGMGLLFITHDMGVVAEIADRALVLKEGRTVESGATHQIFASPQHPYSRRLLAAVPILGSMSGERDPRPFSNSAESQIGSEARTTVRNDRPPLLRVEKLTTRFPLKTGILGRVRREVHAVESVSFELRHGETLALVGESGSGKSTIGRSIMRLVAPTSGSIAFEGQDVALADRRSSRDLRRRMQMIFQDPYASLNPRMRIGEAIAEPLIQHRVCDRAAAAQRVGDLLKQVGMSAGDQNRFPHEFSGGQRQRICIARALALKPALVIADEAVSALDVSTKAQVIDVMIELQRSMGIAYIFISHDMAIVERVSHRVAVLLRGEIVEIGPRDRVLSSPQHAYTRQLIDAVPIPDPAARRNRPVVERSAEPRTVIHEVGYRHPQRQYRNVSPGHFVQAGDP